MLSMIKGLGLQLTTSSTRSAQLTTGNKSTTLPQSQTHSGTGPTGQRSQYRPTGYTSVVSHSSATILLLPLGTVYRSLFEIISHFDSMELNTFKLQLKPHLFNSIRRTQSKKYLALTSPNKYLISYSTLTTECIKSLFTKYIL